MNSHQPDVVDTSLSSLAVLVYFIILDPVNPQVLNFMVAVLLVGGLFYIQPINFAIGFQVLADHDET